MSEIKNPMPNIMHLIQQADSAAVEMERARIALEVAKQGLESAKEGFEQKRSAFELLMSQADEHGFPRAKIRKIIEDRTATLVASGLITCDEKSSALRPAKSQKRQAKADLSRKDEISDGVARDSSTESLTDFTSQEEPAPATLEH